MDVMNTAFFKGFVRLACDGWNQGWHERNGGNLSYRLRDSEVREILDSLHADDEPSNNLNEDNTRSNNSASSVLCSSDQRSDDLCSDGASSNVLNRQGWIQIAGGVAVPNLAHNYFMITAAGSFFRNIKDVPQQCLGIIEINDSGDAYRTCWGFESADHGVSGHPTSELPSHLLIHSAKMMQGSHARVVYHCHPAYTAALTFVLPLESSVITKTLWSMISECAMVFPEGVGVLPWMVPGSIDLGQASADMMEKFNAIIWPHHGLICAGDTFDLTFGLAHTIEKASEIYIKARAANAGSDDFQNRITEANIDELAAAYSLDITCLGKNN